MCAGDVGRFALQNSQDSQRDLQSDQDKQDAGGNQQGTLRSVMEEDKGAYREDQKCYEGRANAMSHVQADLPGGYRREVQLPGAILVVSVDRSGIGFGDQLSICE